VRTQRVGISGTTKRARAADKRRRGDLKASRGHVRDW
jgi:hypothetical protein